MMKRVVLMMLFVAFTLQSCAPRIVERKGRVVIVKKAPRNHRVVVVKNQRYYTWGGNYYRKTSRGFVLVRL